VISSASSIRGARYCFSLEIYLAPILAVPPEAILETDLVKVSGVVGDEEAVVVLNNVPTVVKVALIAKAILRHSRTGTDHHRGHQCRYSVGQNH
jgi:hypothetical protein